MRKPRTEALLQCFAAHADNIGLYRFPCGGPGRGMVACLRLARMPSLSPAITFTGVCMLQMAYCNAAGLSTSMKGSRKGPTIGNMLICGMRPAT
jgi:hypothetical protein